MKPVLRAVLITAPVLGLLSMTVAASAQTQQPTAGSGSKVVKVTITPGEQQNALAFWTHQAIANAKAIPMPADAGSSGVDPAAGSPSQVSGPVGTSPGGRADANADQVARSAYPKDWAASAQSADSAAPADEPAGTSGVYTSYVVNKWAAAQKVYPHKWIGRLSFSTPGGTSYCSGTSISGNVMLTAAHCIYDSTNDQFYSNWVFSPAYRNGSTPYGTFAATTCWVLTAWVNLTGSYAINTWARHDVGVCNMGQNSAGQTLNSAVGFMGRQWNFPYIRHFHDLGYPFRDYNNAVLTNAGLYLRTCAAEAFQQTTETRGMGCNWGPGISGGPWMTNYAPNVVSGFAEGVNSGLFVGQQNLYGARFNSDNIVLLCNSAAC